MIQRIGHRFEPFRAIAQYAIQCGRCDGAGDDTTSNREAGPFGRQLPLDSECDQADRRGGLTGDHHRREAEEKRPTQDPPD